MTVVDFIASSYSDAAYVEGLVNENSLVAQSFHYHCKQYFDNNFKGVYLNSDDKNDIFQESFLTLWKHITSKKIYVEDGVLKGKDGKPFSGKLTTYFISIAKLKNLEWLRKNQHYILEDSVKKYLETTEIDVIDNLFYGDKNEVMLEIIADCIGRLPKGCNQILTMFYYEEKDLDNILKVLTTYNSKKALKTAKHKCMKRLKESAETIYEKYYND